MVLEGARQKEYSSPSDYKQLTPVHDAIFLEQVILDKFHNLTVASGELSMPCVPAMLDEHMRQIVGLLEALGQNLTPELISSLRQVIGTRIAEGFRLSPYSRLIFKYEPPSPSEGLPKGLRLSAIVALSSVETKYDSWVKTREGPLFGSHPDAKVMAIATLLETQESTGGYSRNRTGDLILDVGAGPGRNSLPLARRGHHVHSIELTPVFAKQLLTAAGEEGLAVTVTQGNILDPKLWLQPASYKLAIVSEVISHLREVREVRVLLAKMSEALKPGGLLLFNVFLAVDGYEPSDAVREMSQVAWSYMLTRKELSAAMDGLPLEILSDESALEYEHCHLPAEAWPPTGWFISWASGRNIFPVEQTPPVELRWILARRK